jgi:hypothetical protein
MADLVQTAANVQAGTGAKKRTGIAGGTITAGMAVYLDDADDKYKAQFAGSDQEFPAGIALNNAANGQPLAIQYDGEINLGATLILGEVYCTSPAVAGKIAPVADLVAGNGNYIHILGMAKDASTLAVNLFSVGVAYNEE